MVYLKDGELDVEEGADLLEQGGTEAKAAEQQEEVHQPASRFPSFNRLKKLQIPFIKLKKVKTEHIPVFCRR